jgi:hypothetical protein
MFKIENYDTNDTDEKDGNPQYCLEPVLRIHDILVWIRIRGSMPLTNGSGCGSGPSIFIIDFQDANKKLIF